MKGLLFVFAFLRGKLLILSHSLDHLLLRLGHIIVSYAAKFVNVPQKEFRNNIIVILLVILVLVAVHRVLVAIGQKVHIEVIAHFVNLTVDRGDVHVLAYFLLNSLFVLVPLLQQVDAFLNNCEGVVVIQHFFPILVKVLNLVQDCLQLAQVHFALRGYLLLIFYYEKFFRLNNKRWILH